MPTVNNTTTIWVKRTTADRLGALKIPGLTYDDVINFALDRIPPKDLKDLYEAWQRESLEKLLRPPEKPEVSPAAHAKPWPIGKSSSFPKPRPTSTTSARTARRPPRNSSA